MSLLRSDEEITPPPIPENIVPNSQQAKDFLDSIEYMRYAALARTIDFLFREVFGNRKHRGHDGLLQGVSEARKLDGWQQLALDMNATFINDVKNIEHSTSYRNSEGFASLFGMLSTRRFVSPRIQLFSGSTTGVDSTLTIARNAPNIIDHHEPGVSNSDVASIMLHPASKSLLRKPAKGSVNQLMAARSALEGGHEYNGWTDINRVLDPDKFQLRYYTDGAASMDYADFSGLSVPAGYSPHESAPPVAEETLVKDIPGNRPTTIGCPVTLMQHRLGQLFDWSIELVENRDLWAEDWPPKP